jgi:hypothetical protein
MRDSDQDIVRRALSSVLDRLEGARAGTEITGGDNSIIVIFMGQSNATGDGDRSLGAQAVEPRGGMRQDRAPGASTSHERGFALDDREAQAKHPGLEKFPIAVAETAPSAPKTCFMEPGRACVNSGACEMRGY